MLLTRNTKPRLISFNFAKKLLTPPHFHHHYNDKKNGFCPSQNSGFDLQRTMVRMNTAARCNLRVLAVDPDRHDAKIH
jgi:hypothetical protein